MQKLTLMLLLTTMVVGHLNAQLPDSCKLLFGTNIGGISDYGTELPFIDRMKNARTWDTKDVGNPNGGPFNTEAAAGMSFRPDGYPTHLPQMVPGFTYPQKVATIWAITDGWTPGPYVVLFEGKGKLGFWGGYSNLLRTGANRYTFDFNQPVGGILEMVIDSSDAADPVRNIRVLPAANESNYQEQPFNPVWLDKLLIFNTVRFMDWGHTNSWGQSNDWSWSDTTQYGWSARAQMDHYTWANTKGIPYEMMIRLMNDYDLDGWVCVPHNAGEEYIRQMAQLFHDQLEPGRKLTVEYSNEIWNWIFGQTNWLYQYGCVAQNVPWPEGTVPYIQRCMDIWSEVFSDDMTRITRAVGVQTAWLDVSQRMVFNMRPGSFDVVAPTYYFGIHSEADAELDSLGAAATVADVAGRVRRDWHNEKMWIADIKTKVADPLGLPIAFYEGGQHLTPTPFGEPPTYEQALLDIQRDTALYNLYNEWFDFLRTQQSGTHPLLCMNFSFIGLRSARYGSWGILETMQQDTALVPAPKYRAVVENLHAGCFTVSALDEPQASAAVFPNPACGRITVSMDNGERIVALRLLDLQGRVCREAYPDAAENTLDLSGLSGSVYLLSIETAAHKVLNYKIIKG